jgi:hypothetical protein
VSATPAKPCARNAGSPGRPFGGRPGSGRELLELIAIGLAALLLGGEEARAAEIEGVHFADRMSVEDAELRLRGTGLLRYRYLFKAYVAALYLGESFDGEATPTSVLADVPRRLEIEYFWSIPADAFAGITSDGIARNVDERTLESLQARIEQLNGLYRDVRPGDRYALTYLPGIGTELALNGEPRGLIEGADFASALFALWLGESALDASLRQQLLATP